MALHLVIFSGLFGAIAGLVAAFGLDFSFAQAFGLYLVTSIVPVALVMAGSFVYFMITRSMTAHDGAVHANRMIR